MSTKWLKAIEIKIEQLDKATDVKIHALTLENRAFEKRLAALEKSGEPEEEEVSFPAARVPGRPPMMKEMGYGTST